MDDVVHTLSGVHPQRQLCTRRLQHIYQLAKQTGHLQHFIVFGSYVTAKPDPHDLDLILVMNDEFVLDECAIEARGLFDHAVAQARFGASIFCIRPALVLNETVDQFLQHWQIKRDGTRRGIIEVME